MKQKKIKQSQHHQLPDNIKTLLSLSQKYSLINSSFVKKKQISLLP